MSSVQLTEGPPEVWAVVFDAGDDFPSGLIEWAENAGVGAASFTGIGAEGATLGYYHLGQKTYVDIPVHNQVEVLTLAGDISLQRRSAPRTES